jgi:modulator of drug activity B
MASVLLILGTESQAGRGQLNSLLFDSGCDALEAAGHKVVPSLLGDGYDKALELERFQRADVVIYQFPVYWFSCPAVMKEYIDDLYVQDVFFSTKSKGRDYGEDGMMRGKYYMLSCTWYVEEAEFAESERFFGGVSPDNTLMPLHLTHRFCGFSPLASFHVHSVRDKMDVVKVQERWRAHLLEQLATIQA